MTPRPCPGRAGTATADQAQQVADRLSSASVTYEPWLCATCGKYHVSVSDRLKKDPT